VALLPPDELVQALLIRYDPGAQIGGTATGRCSSTSSASRSALRRRCVSGGAGRVASLAHRCCSTALDLSPDGRGSPSMGAQLAAIEATRWSITFRSLSQKGRKRAMRA
jgi:DNA oxidative demethylase